MISDLRLLLTRLQNEQTEISTGIRTDACGSTMSSFETRDRRNENDRFIAALYAAIKTPPSNMQTSCSATSAVQ